MGVRGWAAIGLGLVALLPATVSAAPKRPAALAPAEKLELFPAGVRLTGHADAQQLLLTATDPSGKKRDATEQAVYRVSNPKIARVSKTGLLTPLADGKAELWITLGKSKARAPLSVSGLATVPALSFVHDIEPVLSRRGCNQGGCHGKATGQNGFRLSLFGFDPKYDYSALVQEGRGRRVSTTNPDDSLLLQKAANLLPHGGGKRIEKESETFALIRRWLEQGAPYDQPNRPELVSLTATPSERLLGKNQSQRMVVTATYTDGATHDVTRDCLFRSNEEGVATVDEEGRVRASKNPGGAAVMASYMGKVAVFQAAVPLGAPAKAFKPFPVQNFVDELIFKKLKQVGAPPSELCTDGEFIRRVSIDLCGRLPEPEEVRAFLADADPDKRKKLVDRLLDDPDYAAFMALKWAGILRNTGQYKNAAYAFHSWIREAFATNMPYDQFVRSIVSAQGEWEEQPATAWFWQFRDGGITELTEDVSQLFLGQRLQCAKCHHHPYEKWGQDDFYGLAGFFTRMGRKIIREPGYYYAARRVMDGLTNPRTGKRVEPKVLDGPVLTVVDGEDPRVKLADWMVDPANPYFAPTFVNRMWAHFMGRGLVEPLDDMRVTNPPTNPELMQALSKDFIERKFDVKALLRTIVTSRTYQLSSNPNQYNGPDRQNYARHYPKRLMGEVMLDGIDQLTGVKTRFSGVSAQARAINLPHEQFSSYFLDVFGRPPQLSSPCECARDNGANLSQVLHLANSGELDNKIAHGQGRAALLAKSDKPMKERIEELYLRAFSRFPTPEELTKASDYVTGEKDQQAAFQDLIWTFINCREFQFQH